ncbi:MAG: pyridoxal-dependent decarboxylase [Candidatus Eisenbacteria bacterium]
MTHPSFPLEPDETQRALLNDAVLSFTEHFLSERATAPASLPAADPELLRRLLAPPEERARPLDSVFEDFAAALGTGFDTTSPGHLSYIPSGGIYSSALAGFLGAVTNRYTGGSHASPGCVAMEESVIRWMTSLFGLPEAAGGILLSGGSLANLTAVVTARSSFGEDFREGVIYASTAAHHSVSKSTRIAGIAPDRVRQVPTTSQLTIDVGALRAAIASDRAAGLRPMMIVSNAGTTDTGSIDPIAECAAVAASEGAWHHVDAAYGGFFQLTERGRERLAGISLADSITVDAHKSLFLPFGIGGLLVRDRSTLAGAHEGRGSYMQDVAGSGLPHYFALGPELTRPNRGLTVWFPLQIHGVALFRDALDAMLDRADWTAQQIAAMPAFEIVCKCDLSVVAFRAVAGDAESRRIFEALNATHELHLSSTTVDGQFVLRLAFLSQRAGMRVAERVIEPFCGRSRPGSTESRSL